MNPSSIFILSIRTPQLLTTVVLKLKKTKQKKNNILLPVNLIWAYTVCLGLFVPIFRVIMVDLFLIQHINFNFWSATEEDKFRNVQTHLIWYGYVC